MGRWRLLALLLCGVGCSTSLYLFIRGLLLRVEKAPGSVDVCSKLFGGSCDATLLLGDPTQLGIPVAGWGIVYYVLLATVIALGGLMRGLFDRETAAAAFLLGLGGLLVSLLLAGMMLFGVAPSCPLCWVVHGVNLALVPVLKLHAGRPVAEIASAVLSGGKYALGGRTDLPHESAWKILGFGCIGLVGVVTYQWVYVETELRRMPREQLPTRADFDEIIQRFRSTEPQPLALSPEDARVGPEDAKVNLLVFSSFRCPGCRTLAGLLTNLRRSFGESVSITYKHFPLHEVCSVEPDPKVPAGSCATAYAAEAARRQGKFWEFHDALYATALDGSEESLRQAVEKAGIDWARWNIERASKRAREKVVADVRLAQELGLTETPALFLNGRRIANQDLNTQALFVLVANALIARPTTEVHQ